MADTVTSQKIVDGERNLVMKFTNISDGTGESAVTKVDVTTLSKDAYGAPCTRVTVSKIHIATHGMEVRMYWDASTDVPFFLSAPNNTQTLDFSGFTSIPNDAGAGVNGNIVFTTVDHTAGDSYWCILEMVKGYT